MTKTSKAEHIVTHIQCNCSLHGDFTIPISECHFTGGEAECELCGSHGSVEVEIICPLCLKKAKTVRQRFQARETITLSSW